MKPLLALTACLLLVSSLVQAADKPNVILILVDDLGWMDLSCQGSDYYKTRAIDQIATEGMRYTNGYAACAVCSPTRAAVQTGRYPHRVGVTDWIRSLFQRGNRGTPERNPTEYVGGKNRAYLCPPNPYWMEHEEITIAEVLKRKGYATACVGKWHLGDELEFLPTRQGFDSYFGIPYSNDMRIRRNGKSGPPLMRDEEIIEHPADQTTLTKRYTEEAVGFIERNKSKPFFLYLPHTMPHIPLYATPQFAGKSEAGLYGDTIEEMDWSVGQIMATLKKLSLDKNTLVIYTSDNGPWNLSGNATSKVKGNMMAALRNVSPSHLLDLSLREAAGLDPVTAEPLQ